MRTSPELSRVLLSSPETALRLNSCTALLHLHLPAAFHTLPVCEQRRAIESAAASAVAKAIDALDNRRVARAG